MADETENPATEAPRKLASSVNVGGKWYRPGDSVPGDVAAKITNPKAWASDTEADGSGATAEAPPGTDSGHQLASRVQVGGKWYGPGDNVPDDIAAKITNPKAWAGGKLPTAPKLAATAGDGEGAPSSGTGAAGVSLAQAADEQLGGADGDVAGDTGSAEEPDARPRRGSAAKKG